MQGHRQVGAKALYMIVWVEITFTKSGRTLAP